MFVPMSGTAVRSGTVNTLANRKGAIGHGAALMKVFMPYLVWNTVFDNTRVTSELGRKPVPFSQYSYPLLKFSRDTNFAYTYQDWPAKVGGFRGMMDFLLEAWVSASIEKSKAGWMLGKGKPWQPGEKLKLLFAGYNGTRNMGSDVRVEEMLRQMRHILGAEQCRIQRDDAEFRSSRRIFREYSAGASAGYFPAISCRMKCRSITAWWRAKARCSRASSPMR